MKKLLAVIALAATVAGAFAQSSIPVAGGKRAMGAISSTPSNGQVPVYNSTTKRWEPGAGGAGGGDVAGPASSVDNEVPLFNGTGGKTLKSGASAIVIQSASNAVVSGALIAYRLQTSATTAGGIDIGDGAGKYFSISPPTLASSINLIPDALGARDGFWFGTKSAGTNETLTHVAIGLGLTNLNNVISNNIVAGANVSIQAGANGQLTIASTASGSGDVVGPSSSVDSELAAFNGTTGKLLKNTGGALLLNGTTNLLVKGGTATDNLTTTNGGTLGGAISIGPFTFQNDSGINGLIDMTVTASSASGTVHGWDLKLDGNTLLSGRGTSDGAGVVTNQALSVPNTIIVSMPPQFAQTADATVANTVTETTIIGTVTGIGKVLAPNRLTAGKNFKGKFQGRYSTTGTPTLRIRVKLGSVVIADTGAITMGSAVSNKAFDTEFNFTCRTTGASGTVWCQGRTSFDGVVSPMVNTATATIDTTASQTLDVMATWGTANAANTVTGSIGLFEEGF